MAAAGKWKVYEQTKLNLGKAAFDLTAGTYNCALFTSASNANTLSTSAKLADLTNEVSNANGYTTGGVALSGVTYTNAAGTETFTSGTAQWTATAAGITARFGVVYKVGTFITIVNPLICVCLLDATPADVTAAAGTTLTITMNASGIFTLSGAITD